MEIIRAAGEATGSAMIDAALLNGKLVNAPVQDWMRRADLVPVQATEVSNEASVIKALLDDATNLNGVYGMGGVGKTALIKAIEKQVKEDQLFQEVVVVIVSQNPSSIKLQGDIAEGSDLSLTGKNLSGRADRLAERLNQYAKTALVILDDVWERIDLSEVGIPYKNRRKRCKVVFITRSGALCDKMEANTKIEVAVLPEEHSYILCRKKCCGFSTISRRVKGM